MGYEATKRIKIVPAEVVVEEYRRHVYKCAGCCDANAKGDETWSYPIFVIHDAFG